MDNIPGVPGLGPKGAAALIAEHGGIAAILADLSLVKKEAVREKLAAARAQIEQNCEMVRLDCDLDLPVALDDLRLAPRYPELLALAERCEFKSLQAELRGEMPAEPVVRQTELF